MMMLQNPQPAVFLATLGLQPQVLTRALDRLLESDQAVVSAVVLHTAAYRPHPQWPTFEAFKAYLEDHYEEIGWRWEPLTDDAGQPLRDVHTPEEAEAAFRVIYRVTRDLKRDGLRIHGLIAGGRKSVIVYSMISAQLLFDVDDQLWHLFSRVEDEVPHVSQEMAFLVEIPVLHLAGVMPMVRELILSGDDPTGAIRLYRQHEDVAQIARLRRFYDGLDPVDQTILRLAYLGYDNRQIGDRVNYGPAAVNSHISSIADAFFTSDAFGRRLDPRPKHIRRPLLIFMRPLLQKLADEDPLD